VSTFVDTSALFAVLDSNDKDHGLAKVTWERLVASDEVMLCTNYILVEIFALVQNRLGLAAARTLQDDVVPLLRVIWLDAESHTRSVAALVTAGRRQLSLVDCASFDAMRRQGVTTAFAFDRHFAEQGFDTLP
jgi:predicted nucleic acid-binding protein